MLTELKIQRYLIHIIISITAVIGISIVTTGHKETLYLGADIWYEKSAQLQSLTCNYSAYYNISIF